MEKVSVIMAVYNGEDYLKKSIESILKQTYPYFEFIIVNDGSSDATKNILNGITDPRVKVYHLKKNYGVSYARNYAVQKSKYRWIILQDHDDISAPDRIEVLMDYIKKNPEIISVLSMFQLFEEKVSAKGRSIRLLGKGPYFTRKQLKSRRFYCPWICFGSAAISREAFLQVGGYDRDCKLGEDFDLFLKLIELGPMEMIPRVLYRYRYNPNSISRRNRQKTRSAIIKISLKHILKISQKKEIRPSFVFFGSPWDCHNLVSHICPEIGLDVKLCIESGNDEGLAKAFSLYKQKKVNGFIVLGSSFNNRHTINWLLGKGMTLNVNLFHLKPFKKVRTLSL